MSMKYVYSQTTSQAIEHIVSSLTSHLMTGERVLWILSGGSGGAVCVEVSRRLKDVPLENLLVTLSDERFGPIGHPDENWQQLLDAGLHLPGATLYRPLIGENRQLTTLRFGEWIEKTILSGVYTVGVFGIGPDGHTAGIKPGTSAVSADGWATDFSGSDFERITMTFQAIAHVDEAIIQAMGADKAPTLKQLLNTHTPPKEQPAQILRSLSQATLYTDYKEEIV